MGLTMETLVISEHLLVITVVSKVELIKALCKEKFDLKFMRTDYV